MRTHDLQNSLIEDSVKVKSLDGFKGSIEKLRRDEGGGSTSHSDITEQPAAVRGSVNRTSASNLCFLKTFPKHAVLSFLLSVCYRAVQSETATTILSLPGRP